MDRRGGNSFTYSIIAGMSTAACRSCLAVVCVLGLVASVSAQSRPTTSTNVVGSSVLFNNTVPTPAQTLQLYPNFLFNFSYCGTPTNLYAQTARVPTPVNGGNSTRTAQSVHIWSVSYQVGNTDLGSSSARLYLLNDNIFFNLEDGTISVGEPEYFLTAARSGGVSLTTPGAGTFQINPTVLSIANINATSGINAVSFTTLVPPFTEMTANSNNDDLYEQYLARIYYFITQVGLGNNNCTAGYPDLAGYSNYLENVLKNVSTGQTYYDGINEDYNFLTTSQANASCLTESATSYQGNVLVNGANNIVSRTADCCQACHAYMRNSTVSANRCNSYLFCESNGGAPCPLSVGGATLPAGGCQLQYSAAVEALAPAPVLGANLGGGIVSGRLTPVKPNNETSLAGFDVPAFASGDNIYSNAVAPSGQVTLQPAGRRLRAINC